ncbi:MAG TPA: iron-containing alcohol dehydrogenase [Syntrophorhabdaceae bacterium]|nr:iron-containing alcohol dehydrogenase [Syntrophorhabdaceae bacterium]HQM80944.1 iron-containing alcohol dehydrogenase [Syntrophorhabdaceae bacterium]
MKDYLRENIRFIVRTEMLVGNEIAKELPNRLKDLEMGRAGLVIDSGLYENNSYARDIIELLKVRLEKVILLVSEMPEPTYDYLDKVKIQFEPHDLDCFVGIGGGSTLDLAKGLATLKTNKGDAINYRGFGKVKNAPLPVIALPSTAGTGSEVTPYAVFIDTKEKWKFGINTEYNYPRLALYDPHFLDSCPFNIYASSGMDAMTHTLESFVAKNATALSRNFSRQAFKLLFENLKKIAKGDFSNETKLNLLVGSGCAGIALMNAGAGPAGALSYPLGVYFDVPHGLAGSVFLSSVIKHNVKAGYEEYAELFDLVFDEKVLSLQEKSLRFAEEIVNLCEELRIPTSLKGFGVKTEADLRQIIDNSMQLKAAFEQNPIPFGIKEIEETIYSLK